MTTTVEETSSTRTAADLAPVEQPPVLDRVPQPSGESVVGLTATAGGLQAVQAEWGVDGGAVVLTGTAPFVDLTGRAGFRSDGALDGRVQMRARVGLLGLDLAEATWTVEGWTPEAALAAPAVALRGSTLAVDLRGLPAEVAFTPATGLDAPRTPEGATIRLPDGAIPAGEPLSPRLVEVYRGLLGVDISGLRVHPDSVPSFVSDRDLFLAPGVYGVDAPEPLRMLDAAIRQAVAGLVPPAPAPTPEAGPASGPVPAEPEPAAVPAAPESTAAPPAETAVPEAAAPEETVVEPAVEGEAPEEAPPPVELIMPEPPSTLTPAASARGGGVAAGAGGAARAARDLPSADQNVADSRGAVTEPVAETAARAREELATELGERPAPSPEIVELVDRIRTAIRENRPEDEDELLETDPTHEAQQAGGTITGSVEGQVQEVGSTYDAMATPPAGTPALTPTPIAAPSPTSPGMGVDAAAAAPDPIPPENTSLDADVAATDQRIADSGIDTRVTREIPDGPFAEARDARGELGEAAQQTPQQIQAQQQQAIEAAQGDMAQLQLQAVAALRASRAGTVENVGGAQSGMVTSEEQTRESVSRRAQQIFDNAQTQVDQLLQPLSRTAIARWEAGLAQLSQTFHDALDRVKRWIDDRHSGVTGTLVAIGDYVAGLPDWVTDEYNRAEREFGDGVGDLLIDISRDVNGVIAAAQGIIQHARDDIDAAFTAMEAEFPEWAAQERARFGGMLDGLNQRVTAAQTSFVHDVSQRAITAVNEVHAEAQALRDAAGGLIGRVVAAIEEFIDDPVRAIINGLLRLVGIPPSAFWALIERISQVISDIADDPENFINNLVAGVKQGFQQFFDNFGTHVLHGFWDWLFSGLETPIPMPRDFSAGSLFSFALQLMGITWPRIREILVRHIGPTAVEVIEAAWQLISVLIERGPAGIVELIKEQLTPENIVGMILEAAVNYLVETLIQQVIVRVIGMLNPVGAIAQAIDLIYQVCSWIFRNAARIFRFVEAVVNGMADVIAGNVGGLATKVEQALASLIPPVIDFLAGLLHLGGLPGEVAEVITRLQTMVYGILDRVIGFLAERGRALLARMGIGGEEEGEGHNRDDELGTSVRFAGGGESHRLWFDRSGDNATLMLASTPAPIENKIADWRSKVGTLDPDIQASTTAKIDAAAAVADDANQQGDALAAQFNAAARDPNDTSEPPDDSAVEARERALSGMLRELFEIFKEKPDPEVLFASQLQRLVHSAARGDVLIALRALPEPIPTDWGTASTNAKTTERGQVLENSPLNQGPPEFGATFGHTWATAATLRALRESYTTMNTSTDANVRRRILKTMTTVDNDGGRTDAGASAYLGRYKAQLHAENAPFDVAPSSLTQIRKTIWQRSFQNTASSRIREQMIDRIKLGGEGAPGPDLPQKVREEIWRLLAAASLSSPTGTTEIRIEISAASAQAIQTYLDNEAALSGSDPAMQRTLQWWSGHIMQAEFHHAWPQWLGGAFNQTQIFIPRALHNFEGLTAGGVTFPGGFHQVFNALFSAAFAAQIAARTLAINDADKWTAYVTANPTARDTLAGILVQAYKTVFAPFGPAGVQALTVFVNECKNTYPQTPNP